MDALLANLILVVVILAIVTAIVVYLVRSKKRGETCIGCPYCKQCSGKCSGDSGHKTP